MHTFKDKLYLGENSLTDLQRGCKRCSKAPTKLPTGKRLLNHARNRIRKTAYVNVVDFAILCTCIASSRALSCDHIPQPHFIPPVSACSEGGQRQYVHVSVVSLAILQRKVQVAYMYVYRVQCIMRAVHVLSSKTCTPPPPPQAMREVTVSQWRALIGAHTAGSPNPRGSLNTRRRRNAQNGSLLMSLCVAYICLTFEVLSVNEVFHNLAPGFGQKGGRKVR